MVNTDRHTHSQVEHIARQFTGNADLIRVEPYSGGIINQTWLATTDTARFILQRINPQVFPQPQRLISNLVTLLAHVQQQKNTGHPPLLKFPKLLTSRDGKPCVIDTDGSTWRALSFIENTRTLSAITTDTEAQQVGYALGQFHRQVHDLDPRSLHDTLPGFHSAPDYFKHYQQLISTQTRPNNPKLSQCQHFVAQRQDCFAVLEQAKQQGFLRTRPIHGDPKLANILFDHTSGQAVALIDLDTVMPGLIHYDIGDCLRSCCNTAKQADYNASQPAEFDFDLCKLILTRYLSETQIFLSTDDYQYLYDAIHLIPLELGLRYLSDYLAGNRYFSVDTPDQNLHRAIQQFELTASIERQQVAIQQLINQNTPQ